MKKRTLQVSLHVTQPSVVQLDVGDRIQLDRLSLSLHGYLAERHGDLLGPGPATLHLDEGFYHFKTLTDAHLKVVSGGITASTAVNNPKDPRSPPSRGDGPEGDAPTLILDNAQEARP